MVWGFMPGLVGGVSGVEIDDVGGLGRDGGRTGERGRGKGGETGGTYQ